MKFKLFFATIALTGIILTNCKKDDTDPNPYYVVNATSFTNWVYFSFEKGDSIKVTDPKTSTEWDLAFRRNIIRTNSGLSGPGNAGGYSSGSAGQAGFDNFKVVPENATFLVDDSTMVLGKMKEVKDIANPILKNNFIYGNQKLAPSDTIYVIRTAKGKYAKVWFKSYYNDKNADGGYIKMQYKYQADGSKNLE